jgi:hypothetical protein
MNWVLELGGIGLMAAGVIRRIRAAKADASVQV